jgi:hypothetical protein
LEVKKDIPGTETKAKDPFCGCSRPKPDTEYCFLIEHETEISTPNPRPGTQTRYTREEHVITEGLSDASSYLSELFERDIDDPAGFIEGMTPEQMKTILSKNYVNGQLEGEATIYICDTGSGGGIKKVHSRSATLEL